MCLLYTFIYKGWIEACEIKEGQIRCQKHLPLRKIKSIIKGQTATSENGQSV